MRSGFTGVRKILRFNWPWYAGAAVVTAAAAWSHANGILTAPWHTLALLAMVAATLWLLLSIVVSHAIYDRSAVARGEWLEATPAQRVAVFHFGQDEASAVVARRWPAAHCQTLDLHDPARSGTPSLRRARAAALGAASTQAALDRLPLEDGCIDVGLLVFAAHEVRDEGTRVVMFRELGRVLAPAGRLIVVEHLRSAWNLLAYGPGMFHFLSRRTWLSTFARAGLAVQSESRLTPWVARFELGRNP